MCVSLEATVEQHACRREEGGAGGGGASGWAAREAGNAWGSGGGDSVEMARLVRGVPSLDDSMTVQHYNGRASTAVCVSYLLSIGVRPAVLPRDIQWA